MKTFSSSLPLSIWLLSLGSGLVVGVARAAIDCDFQKYENVDYYFNGKATVKGFTESEYECTAKDAVAIAQVTEKVMKESLENMGFQKTEVEVCNPNGSTERRLAAGNGTAALWRDDASNDASAVDGERMLSRYNGGFTFTRKKCFGRRTILFDVRDVLF